MRMMKTKLLISTLHFEDVYFLKQLNFSVRSKTVVTLSLLLSDATIIE